jgi:hypothetical protein
MGLSPNYVYNDINDRCSEMIDVIEKSKDYKLSYKKSIISFLNEAKLKLIKEKKRIKNEEEREGFIEDYDKLLIPNSEGRVANQTSTTYAGHSFVMNKETVSINDAINKREYLNPIETFPTNISRSELNNLKRKTILQTLVLNTLFREDYTNTSSSDFSILLPYYFKNVLSVRLSSIQLPNVIYTISEYNGNNTFYIHEVTTGVSGKIIIPDGNYFKIDEFATMLQREINDQLNINPQRFVVEFYPNSRKITISNSVNNFNMSFYKALPEVKGVCDKILGVNNGYRKSECVDISEIYKKFGWIMGYRKDVYDGSNNYTTEGIYNTSYPNYIYFTLNDYNNSQSQNVFGLFSKSIIGDNILAMIPVTGENLYMNYNSGGDLIEKKRDYFGPVRIQRMKIQLLNQYGESINLNNMDYSFSLEFEVGYDY